MLKFVLLQSPVQNRFVQPDNHFLSAPPRLERYFLVLLHMLRGSGSLTGIRDLDFVQVCLLVMLPGMEKVLHLLDKAPAWRGSREVPVHLCLTHPILRPKFRRWSRDGKTSQEFHLSWHSSQWSIPYFHQAENRPFVAFQGRLSIEYPNPEEAGCRAVPARGLSGRGTQCCPSDTDTWTLPNLFVHRRYSYSQWLCREGCGCWPSDSCLVHLYWSWWLDYHGQGYSRVGQSGHQWSSAGFQSCWWGRGWTRRQADWSRSLLTSVCSSIHYRWSGLSGVASQ